jgi:hypothetical protein
MDQASATRTASAPVTEEMSAAATMAPAATDTIALPDLPHVETAPITIPESRWPDRPIFFDPVAGDEGGPAGGARTDIEALPAPEPVADPERSPYRMLLPWVLAALLVVGVVAAFRFIHTNGGRPGTLTPTTITHHSTTVNTTAITPSGRELLQVAKVIQQANAAIAQGLAAAGASTTVPSLIALENSYGSAVNQYYFELHLITLPPLAATDLHNEYAQLQALKFTISSVLTVNQASVSPWIAQFRAVATATQTVDNRLRKDVGLQPTSTFP